MPADPKRSVVPKGTQPGAHRLRAALRRLGRKRQPAEITAKPTTAFEAILVERLRALQRDVARLEQAQVWLIRLAIAALIGALLKYVLG